MYLKRKRGTFYASESHLGSSYNMSFRSEAVVKRFNKRKERVNTVTEISHFTK